MATIMDQDQDLPKLPTLDAWEAPFAHCKADPQPPLVSRQQVAMYGDYH